jgi:putative FmdB family regulatory protein
MPIFEYKCRECGLKFEKIIVSSAIKVECKKCGSSQVEKLLSVFAVAGTPRTTNLSESGPCGACGAPRRGMCEE